VNGASRLSLAVRHLNCRHAQRRVQCAVFGVVDVRAVLSSCVLCWANLHRVCAVRVFQCALYRRLRHRPRAIIVCASLSDYSPGERLRAVSSCVRFHRRFASVYSSVLFMCIAIGCVEYSHVELMYCEVVVWKWNLSERLVLVLLCVFAEFTIEC
jgi:hypothetical protein